MTASSSPSTDEENDLAEEFFEKQHRFYRWRFLQDLLEGDADTYVTNRVLSQVFEGAVKYPRPDGNSGGDIVALPVEVRQRIQALLDSSEMVHNGRVVALREDYDDEASSKAATETLQILEELLPTPDEDEDAVKSLWDTVMELHGRGAVQYQQTQDNTLEWKLNNTVARLLIHFDFLTLGIVRAPPK